MKNFIKYFISELSKRQKRQEYKKYIQLGQPVKFDYEGNTYYLNPDQSAIYHLENSTKKINNLVRCIQGEPEVVFDVGANCGIFSSMAQRRFPKAQIHAFEPSHDLIEFIKMNNPEHVLINELALGDKEGEVDFFVNKQSQQTNSIQEDAVRIFLRSENQLEVRKVKMTTLDSYCRDKSINHIDILKIDVQGYEDFVLKGANQILETVQQLFIESVWIEIGSIQIIFDLCKTGYFAYITIINDVYSGADLVLSKQKLPDSCLIKKTFEIKSIKF